MPSDPLTFWLQGSMFWATVFRAQHRAYLNMLCKMANTMPRESAAAVAAEADSLRRAAPKPTPLHRRPRAAKKPSSAAKTVPA